MTQNVEVYDLGNVEARFRQAAQRRAPFKPAEPTVRRRPVGEVLSTPGVTHFKTDITRSLSVFVPGASQLVQGRSALGLFFLTALGFLGSLAWAVIDTIDRLVPILSLFGQSVTIVLWTLCAAYVLAASIHLAAVWTAVGPTGAQRPPRHPVIPAIASLMLPGWGQVLNGDRVRGVLFLGGCWLVAAAWISASASALDMVSSQVPMVQPWEQSVRAPFVIWSAKWTLPLLLWIVAVYDAAASAVSRRGAR